MKSFLGLAYPQALNEITDIERYNDIDLFIKRVETMAKIQIGHTKLKDNLFHQHSGKKAQELLESIAQMEEMLASLPIYKKSESPVFQHGNEIMMQYTH
jgi:hypothetical protein